MSKCNGSPTYELAEEKYTLEHTKRRGSCKEKKNKRKREKEKEKRRCVWSGGDNQVGNYVKSRDLSIKSVLLSSIA